MRVPRSFRATKPICSETGYRNPFDLWDADGWWAWRVYPYPPFPWWRKKEAWANPTLCCMYDGTNACMTKTIKATIVWWHQRRELFTYGRDMKEELASSTGSHLFHQLVYRYEQSRAKQTQPLNKWAENDGLKLYPTFEWTCDGDLVLNTVNVDYKRQVARVEWGRTLALRMGWIEQVSTGVYRLGPNILQEFHSDSIPTPSDVVDGSNKPAFWKVDGDYMNLSMTCNWRFVNLNATFRPSLEFPSVRPLHVYCDVGTSSVVGGRITDLLREIKYQPKETTHFEPRHIQYVPVRNEVVEIVETQMAEINGDLAQFGEGHTLLTLHFKREVVV